MGPIHSLDRTSNISYMTSMANYLESQVADRRKALIELDRRRIVLEAELRAYEDALRHEFSAVSPGPNGKHEQAAVELSQPEAVERIAAFDRLTDGWRKVLSTLSSREVFRSHDMHRVAHEQGMNTSMPNVRSQLTLLTQRGILRRVGPGEYTVEPVADLLKMLE
jgi:hypothetical protein